MDFPCPEGSDELLPDLVRVPHVGLRNVKDDLHAGACHAEAGLTLLRHGAAPDGPHTFWIEISIVEQQDDPKKCPF